MFCLLRFRAALSLVIVIGGASRGGASVEPGELLLAEMNCVACHDAPAEIQARLASRQAPGLGEAGLRLTPQWLRTFLASPSAEKSGLLMPDMLHALTQTARTEAVEALTHYLVSRQKPLGGMAAGASAASIAAGNFLYHSVGCVACHAPIELPLQRTRDAAAADELKRLAQNSVPIGRLAAKMTVNELAAFLKNPLETRPSGRMPALQLSDGEARAIATYLLREQASTPSHGAAPARISGLTFEYYEQSFPELPRFERLTATAIGSVDTFSLKAARRKNDFALRFHGIITAPKSGDYKFYVESDDGARLSIDEKEVVDNGGIHPQQERSETIKLAAGDHTIAVVYFDGGGETELKVRWKGPGIDKQEIPVSVLSHEGQPMTPLGDAPFTVDSVKAEHGRKLFTQFNCGACHRLDGTGAKAKPLAQLAADQRSGCLSANPAADVPRFELDDQQRSFLRAQLHNQAALAAPLDDSARIERTLSVLNCYACHQRNNRGGVSGLRADYFVSTGEVDLGDEGRIPPHLTGVGAKLEPAWLGEVLTHGGAVRPYMATRMPQFGADNVQHLVVAFEKVDHATRSERASEPAAAKFGRKLVGVGGLTCVACHTFAGHASLGVPAIDLATMGSRLQPDWFRRYLLDPQSLRPGTRMPGFWPNGQAANKEILAGNTEKQISAIWAYLGKGKEADLPDGLVQGKEEIIADREAVIYRNFIAGAGARAIGVGYPEKANLAFDANEMRIAMIWQGPFIDAARHRNGRGDGYEKPLGANVQPGPPGAPFALLANPSAPWPKETGHAAGYQFRGYRLDEKRRPTFLYVFNGVQVEDYPLAVPAEVDANFQRTLTLRALQPIENVFFRAALGEKIEQKGDVFVVNGKVQMKFSGAHPVIRQAEGKTELLVPVTFNAKEATIVQEISW